MKTLAIITGASSGMGREFAKQIYPLCQADEMWIVARRKEKLTELADELKCLPRKIDKKICVKPVEMDLTGALGAQKFHDYLENEKKSCGSVSILILVNNAGFGTYGTFATTKVEKELEMVELNCTSLTGMCGYTLPYMERGSILINVASLAAFMPLGNFAVYGATKSYVLSFSVALGAEVKERGIKVCALCPGSVSTEFANVASNGARKEVLHGKSPEKVVAHCLKKAKAGKPIAIMALKWKFSAFICRIFSRSFGAMVTYKFNKRPANPF